MMAPYPVHRQMFPANASLICVRLGTGVAGEQVDGGNHDARCAEAALHRPGTVHRLLDRMKPDDGADPLDGDHRRTGGVGRHHQTGADQLAVEDDAARPTFTLLAGILRPGQL